MEIENDVVIVGMGVAGLFCALQLPTDKKITMICKSEMTQCNSYLAQGGIATLRDEDDYWPYFQDTMKAGRYQNNEMAVHTMIKTSPEIIQQLLEHGVAFDRQEGQLDYTREGAHSTKRILHHKDITGREIVETLLTQVKERDNITLLEHCVMLDVLIENEEAVGVWVHHNDEQFAVCGKQIVLATGGVGGLFESSTNQAEITGDSIAIAIERGIELQDIRYIQIHPTVLYTQQKGRQFLISEAVRGEGAYLLNDKGERFVDELLPRDMVTQAIVNQMAQSHKPYVWLDMAHLGKEKILGHFPNIYERCRQEGYDLTCQPIPVTPAQHYFMGGIKVNLEGCTNIKHLYAIGETSCNGVHGANRLASNSLLESMVFAKRSATYMIKVLETTRYFNKWKKENQKPYDLALIEAQHRRLVLEEIKRRDGKFYDQWCKYSASCG